jgi:sugar/nucleoside kinase (ribokinase family)
MRILVAGELNADAVFVGLASLPRLGHEVLAEDFSLELGSSSAICAAGLARLGNEVAFITKVGTDWVGRFCLDQLKRVGVDASPAIIDPVLKTGMTVAMSTVDRALLTYPGTISELSASDISTELLAGFCHLHVSSYFLQRALQPGLARVFAAARRLGLTTSLDPGADPAERWRVDIAELLESVDVFLPNAVELAALTGCSCVEAGLRALDNGHTLTVAKLGKQGCAVLRPNGLLTVPAIPVQPRDTTGAGDSFNAGFLHARLQGRDLEDCLRCGVVCGGLSTQAPGGIAGQPDWTVVQTHLELAGWPRL